MSIKFRTGSERGVAKSEAKMQGKIEKKFGEALGRIAAIDPARARVAKGESFKFASEKPDNNGDVVELPNPLSPRRSIN